jgi:hypothetical protein
LRAASTGEVNSRGARIRAMTRQLRSPRFQPTVRRGVGGVEVSLSEGNVESGDDDSFRRHHHLGTKTEIDSLFLATVRLGYAFDRSLVYVMQIKARRAIFRMPRRD